MLLKNQILWIVLLLVTTPLYSHMCHAFDLSLLKNDKEASSHAYKKINSNQRVDPFNSSVAYQLLGQSFNALEANRRFCNLSLVQTLNAKLEAAKISIDHDSILNLLIDWRSKGLIDDLLFEIIDKSSALNDSLLNTEDQKTLKSNRKRAQTYLNSIQADDDSLAASYAELSTQSLKNNGCAVEGWLRLSHSLGYANTKEKNIAAINAYALSKNIISKDSYMLVEGLRTHDALSIDLSISKYVDVLQNSKNKFRPTKPSEFDLQTNELSSKLKRKKTTYRKDLYTRFSPQQITLISDLLVKLFNRMEASKVELVFTYKTDNEVIPISPMGQYLLARKLLRKDMEELSRSVFFKGATITHEDLITAGIETGLVTASMLKSALAIDNIWNPEVSRWKKITDYAFRVTGTATFFLPPPYNFISSIVLIFVDGIISKKSNQSSQMDALYDVF